MQAAVCNVPSIGMWDAPELETIAETWQDKIVVIVPDADWYENALVDRQALLFRTRLRKLGIDTHVAAPDVQGLDVEPPQKGVDDYLGAGGALGDLIVRDIEAPNLDHWVEQELRKRRKKDAVIRDAHALEGLSLHAVESIDGSYRIKESFQTIARILDVHEKKRREEVPKILESLRDSGAIRVRSGSIVDVENVKYFGEDDGVWMPQLAWKHDPDIELADFCRARERFPRLREIERGAGYGAPIDEEVFVRVVRGFFHEGLSPAQIAERLGVTLSSVYHWRDYNAQGTLTTKGVNPETGESLRGDMRVRPDLPHPWGWHEEGDGTIEGWARCIGRANLIVPVRPVSEEVSKEEHPGSAAA